MKSKSSRLNFTIDQHLNPWVPRPPWQYLPYRVSYFLGHRAEPQKPVAHLFIIFWATIGIFSGLTIIEAVNQRIPSFQAHEVPTIIGSFGAAAVLEFYAIESPLAQPRSAVISQLLASVIGVSIRKLFELGYGSRELIWLGGSLSCALATALMALTNTVHPPAGATALLVTVDSNLASVGWFVIPVILLGCVLMQAVALLINNIQRRFPIYWWSPEDVGQKWIKHREGSFADIETGSGTAVEKTTTSGSSQFDDGMTLADTSPRLVVTRTDVKVPEGLYLTPEEFNFLEELRQRL